MHPALANKSTLTAPGEPPTDPSTLGGSEGQLRDMLREKFRGAHRSPPAKRPEGVRRLCVVLPDSLQPEGVGPNDEIDLSGWRPTPKYQVRLGEQDWLNACSQGRREVEPRLQTGCPGK